MGQTNQAAQHDPALEVLACDSAPYDKALALLDRLA